MKFKTGFRWQRVLLDAILLTMAVGSTSVHAYGNLWWNRVTRISSEIIVPLSGSPRSNASRATDARKRAQSAVDEHAPAEPVVVVVPSTEEDSLVSPARVGRPSDNRTKAAEYLRETDKDRPSPPLRVIIENTAPAAAETPRENVERNLSKARRYSDGSLGSGGSKAGTYIQNGTAVGVIGSDGIVVVVCDPGTNTAGRIGDDTQSGNYFNVVVNGKLAKARCK